MRSQDRRSLLEEGLVELRWRRCREDPAFFFTHLFIPSQRDKSGREPFRLFDYQQDDLATFQDNRFVVVLKSRQLGLSTLVGAYALWLCLFHPGSVVLWISNNQENANKAVGMLDVMWGFLPEWVRERAPNLTSDQAGKKEWTFPDGMTSRIRSLAGTATAGASETASLVILDEFGLIDPHIQGSLLRSAQPTTDAGGRMWMISTARGGHNRFAETFRKASRGESQYTPIFHPWMVSRFVNPLAHLLAGCDQCQGSGLFNHNFCTVCVDSSAYQVKAREFADEPWLFASDYPTTAEEAFRESGRPRFPDLPKLEDCETQWLRGELVEQADSQVRFEPDEQGPLRIREDVYGRPVDRQHVLMVDPATGSGGDYTAATVLRFDDDGLPDRVAWWHANDIEPVDVAERMDLLGRWFAHHRPALLAVETTGGWGDSMVAKLRALSYPNLYVHRLVGRRRRTRETKIGFQVHRSNRSLVIDRLAGYVSTKVDGGPLLEGIDPLLRYELGTFVRRPDGKVAADTGCHDDLVMSTAAALWVLTEETVATAASTGEGVVDEDARKHRLSLQGLFDQIEDARREQARADQRASRTMQRRLRSAVKARRTARLGGY